MFFGVKHTQSVERDEGYNAFEREVSQRVSELTGPLFTTDTDPDRLWESYLEHLPLHRRQHYTCTCCRRFIQLYGGLVTIDGEGDTHPVIWSGNIPDFFVNSVMVMRDLVCRARVNGVFLNSQETWGTPVSVVKATGFRWTHLSGKPMPTLMFKDKLKNAEQAMAERKEEYGMLRRAMAEFDLALATEALRVLEANVLDRSGVAKSIAEWYHQLLQMTDKVRGPRKDNLVWSAVAKAPTGWAHIRSTMIGTLLDDIRTGLGFDAVSRRWMEKMHPLQYRRPTKEVTDGMIAQANKVMSKLEAEGALQRRYARLEDIIALNPVYLAGDKPGLGDEGGMWMPGDRGNTPAPAAKEGSARAGAFDHLKGMAGKKGTEPNRLELPATTMTWKRFRDEVLPLCSKIEYQPPYDEAGYFGLVTAVNPDAPPIIMWDGLDGHPRNSLSWYHYVRGTKATQWGLTPMEWVEVTAIFMSPPAWQDRSRFPQYDSKVMFTLKGAVDQNEHARGSFFPETLKNEFHAVRAVMEKYNNNAILSDRELATACGISLDRQGWSVPFRLRVTYASHVPPQQRGATEFVLDRWM